MRACLLNESRSLQYSVISNILLTLWLLLDSRIASQFLPIQKTTQRLKTKQVTVRTSSRHDFLGLGICFSVDEKPPKGWFELCDSIVSIEERYGSEATRWKVDILGEAKGHTMGSKFLVPYCRPQYVAVDCEYLQMLHMNNSVPGNVSDL